MKKLFLALFLLIPTFANADNWVEGFDKGPQSGNANNNSSILSTGAWVDPIATPGSDNSIASGVVTTTTGTITVSTNQLTVVDATGWTVGMGIAVANAGTGGTTELITYITGISGNVFTLNNNAIATATAQTVSHDDTRALQTAVRSGKNVHLRAGNFNVTTEIDIDTKALIVQGDGDRGRNVANGETLTTMGTVIVNRGATNNVFAIKIGDTAFYDFSIEQSTTISSTAGYAIVIGNGATKILNVKLANMMLYKISQGINIGNAVSDLHVTHVKIWHASGTNAGVFVNNSTPAGDFFFTDDYILCVGGGKGLYITSADTSSYMGLKTNNCNPGIKIDDSNGGVINQRFINMSTEGGPSATGNIVISSTGTGTVHSLTFVGGETGVAALGPGMTISNHATDINVQGILFYNLGNGVSIQTDGGYVTVHGNTFSQISSSNINLGCTSATNNVYLSGNRFDGSGTQIANCGTTSVLDMGNLKGNINVGIGTTIALSSLAVNGGTALGTFNNLTAPSNGLIVSGNVGVGTASATGALFSVGGNAATNQGKAACVGTGTNGISCLGYATAGAYPAATCTCF